MCMGGGPVGPQKYSGGTAASSVGKDNSNDDSDGNAFGSMAYHDKIRSDAAARSQPNRSDVPMMRKGTAHRRNLLTRTVDKYFPKA